MNIIQGNDITVVEESTVIAKLIKSIAKLTATEMLTLSGGLKPFISKSEAYRMYGRGKVDKWIAEGYLSLSQDEAGTSSKMRINRSEIDALAQADDLIHYQIMRDNESKSKERASRKSKRST